MQHASHNHLPRGGAEWVGGRDDARGAMGGDDAEQKAVKGDPSVFGYCSFIPPSPDPPPHVSLSFRPPLTSLKGRGGVYQYLNYHGCHAYTPYPIQLPICTGRIKIFILVKFDFLFLTKNHP